MNPTDNCPHCGAEVLLEDIFKCHSYGGSRPFRSMLCREREERQKAEAELEFTRNEYLAMSSDLDCLQAHWMELSGIKTWGKRISQSVPDLVKAWKKAEAENQKLRELCEELISCIDIPLSAIQYREALNQLTK